MVPRSLFQFQLLQYGTSAFSRSGAFPQPDNGDALNAAIEDAQQRYPEHAARVKELGDLLTSLALAHAQRKHFLNMGCIDNFMGQGTAPPLSCGPEGPGGDSDRWGVMLKTLYQSCGPDAARTLWIRFSPTLRQALEPLRLELHLA